MSAKSWDPDILGRDGMAGWNGCPSLVESLANDRYQRKPKITPDCEETWCRINLRELQGTDR